MSEDLQIGDRVTRDGYPSVGTVAELAGDVVVVQWDEVIGQAGLAMRTGELVINLEKVV